MRPAGLSRISTYTQARYRFFVSKLQGFHVDDSMTLKNNRPSGEEVTRIKLINSHVGKRIRLRRYNLGLSPADVAASLGVGYQQLQHYERGGTQVSSSSLYILAQLFNVPVSFFFDEMPDPASYPQTPTKVSVKDPLDGVNIFFVEDIKVVETEVRDLAKVFYGIESQATRKGVIEFLKILAKNN